MAKTSIPPSAHKFCTSHRHLLGTAHRFKWRLANIMICVHETRGKSNSNFGNKNFIMTRRVQSATAALIVTSYYYITMAHNIEPRAVYEIIGSQPIPAIVIPPPPSFGNSIFSYLSVPYSYYNYIFCPAIIIHYVRNALNSVHHHPPRNIGLGTLLRWGELNKNKLYPHVFEFVTLVDQISGSPTSKINHKPI